jgi:hypothetical protein
MIIGTETSSGWEMALDLGATMNVSTKYMIIKPALFAALGLTMILMAGEPSVVRSRASINQGAQRIPLMGEGIPQQISIVGEVEQLAWRLEYQQGGAHRQIITHPGASFIKVHFLTFDLMPGEYVTVSDPIGAEEYTYPGSDFTSDSESGFWAMSITGDTAVVQLHSQLSEKQLSESAVAKSGLVIDKYGRGYPEDEIAQIIAQSVCGASDQRRDAICYQGTNPVEYSKSDAVARLLIYYPGGFYALCTAWRVGPDASMLTNQHCLAAQSEVAASEVWFNYENQICGVSSLGISTKVTGNSLLISDPTLDFTLFSVSNAQSIVDFGYLDIDVRPPILGEQIHIPQHGGGNPKQLGIDSDLNDGNVCRIDAAIVDGYGSGTDTGYYCDTSGGSSGSPVLSTSSNKVIAMHHFGTDPQCVNPNQGVRMDLIWPLVEPYLLQVSPFGLIGNHTPSYVWKEMSSATWYYLWVNGPNGNVIKQWYEASSVCAGGICSVTPSGILGIGAYTWWIRTWNPTGYGPWSNGMSFDTPVIATPGASTLISPSGLVSNYNPVYAWSEVLVREENVESAATWYYLWVNGPTGNMIKQWYEASSICSGGTCSVTPSRILGMGAHTWWVRAWNPAGYGPWSDGMSFATPVPTPPGIATLISPSGLINNDSPTYTWNEAHVNEGSQESAATWYYLWVNGPSGNAIKQWYEASSICSGGTCSVAPGGTLGEGAHTWWVRAWNPGGYGPWSDGIGFDTP